mgnify:CR=1 FL=1|jgi:hypothetical protein
MPVEVPAPQHDIGVLVAVHVSAAVDLARLRVISYMVIGQVHSDRLGLLSLVVSRMLLAGLALRTDRRRLQRLWISLR